MPFPTRPRAYRQPDAVRDPVARTLAVMRGSTPGAAHQLELRLKSQSLTLMHAFRAAGKVDRGRRWLTDLAHALDPHAPDLRPEAIRAVFLRSQEADAAEMEAGEGYHLDPTPATARRWRIASETACEAHRDKCRVLRAIEERAP